MKRVSIRDVLTPADIQLFLHWVLNTSNNCYDPSILSYPKATMLAADDEEGPFAFLPMQSAIMLESLAVMAGTTPRKMALALARFGKAIDEIAEGTGVREVYFLCRDDNVADLCAQHGFDELLDFRVLRRKIKLGAFSDKSQE
jgi:hypothetical protein